MKFDTGRRRSSAGFIFALGAAALATAPIVSAAPASGSLFEGFSFGRRGSTDSKTPLLARQPDAVLQEREEAVAPHQQKLRRSSASASGSDYSASARLFPKRSMARVLHARQGGCLDSSANEDDINTLLWDGGDNVRIALCPGAVINISGPISFSNANQEIYTVGYPTDNTRAKIVVTGQYQEVAIWNNCDRCTNTAIRNIAIDGSRPSLGRYGNSGLIEMGGNAKGQVVDSCDISNPRGWTAIHVAEGYRDSCSNQFITNNEIGPCGTSPNTAKQFRVVMTQLREFMATPKRLLRKRQTQAPGQWADGISLACRNSTVTGNTITGATDGGIVLFGAPGSTITGNTIIAKDNTLLGGINLVDHGPFNGDYSGTVVSGNTIIADNAMIKIGVAVGLLAWGDYNSSDYRTTGGIITDNTFIANGGGTGYFGYGTAVGGNNGAVVDGNNYDEALFGGTTSYACQNGKTPPPQASIWDPYTTSGGSYQPGVTNLVDFNFLICTMPCLYDTKCATNMTLVKNVETVNTTASTTTWSTSTVPGTVVRTPATTTTKLSTTVTSGTSTTLTASTTSVSTGLTGSSTGLTGTATATASSTTGTNSVASTSTGLSTTGGSTSLSSSSTTSRATTSGTSTAISSGVSRNSSSSSTTSGTTNIFLPTSSTTLSSGTATTGLASSTTGSSASTSRVSTSTSTTSKATTTTAKPATTTSSATSKSTTTTSKASTTTTSKPTTSSKTTSTTSSKPATTSKATSTTSSKATTSTSVGLALGRGSAIVLLPVTTPKTTSTSSTAKTSTTSKKTSTTAKTTSTSAKTTSTSVKTTSTSVKTTSTSVKTTSTSTKASSTTAKTTSTSAKATSTTVKTTSTSTKPTTTSTTQRTTSVFQSSSTKANLAATSTVTLARSRGSKRSAEDVLAGPRPVQKPRRSAEEEVEEIEEQLRAYSQSLLRSRTKRDMDEVARLEHKLLVYRDWILPGAVRTPSARRNLISEDDLDKRDVLADDEYWS